ncbi:MAG: hypothetical protein U0271_47900 [Polyangiaceae bacterium]
MHGHLARALRLHVLLDAPPGVVGARDHELPEGREVVVDVVPAKRRDLAEAHAAQEFQRVEHAPILGDARVGDGADDLLALEDRARAPHRVLVDLLRERVLLEHAGVRVDELVGDGALEHRVEHPVDVAHGHGRELLLLAADLRLEVQKEVLKVPRAHVAKHEIAECGERVEPQASLVVPHGPEPLALTRRDPLGGVATHRERPVRAGAIGALPLDLRLDLLQQLLRAGLLADGEARRDAALSAGEVDVPDPELVSALVDGAHVLVPRAPSLGAAGPRCAAARDTPGALSAVDVVGGDFLQ